MRPGIKCAHKRGMRKEYFVLGRKIRVRIIDKKDNWMMSGNS